MKYLGVMWEIHYHPTGYHFRRLQAGETSSGPHTLDSLAGAMAAQLKDEIAQLFNVSPPP
jgi:hypothetical protein